MKVTSAYANKMLKKLNEEKDYWVNKEKESMLYTASADEEPVIPDYEYGEVSETLEQIEKKICKIKHAINVTNCTNEIQVGDAKMTADMILVKMAQLNRRKSTLDGMRKQQPKSRISSGLYSARKAVPEYQYINYDLDLIKREYEQIDAEVSAMQIALDKYNQTVEFDVDI